jgi:hypothetical protein
MSSNDVPFVVKSGEEFPAGGEDSGSVKRPTENKLLAKQGRPDAQIETGCNVPDLDDNRCRVGSIGTSFPSGKASPREYTHRNYL